MEAAITAQTAVRAVALAPTPHEQAVRGQLGKVTTAVMPCRHHPLEQVAVEVAHPQQEEPQRQALRPGQAVTVPLTVIQEHR